MTILASMLSPAEWDALAEIYRVCGTRYRPINCTKVSRTKAVALAKLGLVDIRRGDLDGVRLLRVSELGVQTLPLSPQLCPTSAKDP